MIIPIRCMNCGFMLADKWRYYQTEVARLRKERGLGNEPIYIDGTSMPDSASGKVTPERETCDKLGITRYCCRKVLLTHRDLIEKI
jgi:DNA-directed RNA polymerase I, II, and III subunit RPABC5